MLISSKQVRNNHSQYHTKQLAIAKPNSHLHWSQKEVHASWLSLVITFNQLIVQAMGKKKKMSPRLISEKRNKKRHLLGCSLEEISFLMIVFSLVAQTPNLQTSNPPFWQLDSWFYMFNGPSVSKNKNKQANKKQTKKTNNFHVHVLKGMQTS